MELLSLKKFLACILLIFVFLNTVRICNCDSPLSRLKDSFFLCIISTLSQEDWRKTFSKKKFNVVFPKISGFYLPRAYVDVFVYLHFRVFLLWLI